MKIDVMMRILAVLLVVGGQAAQADPSNSSKSSGLTQESGFTKTVQPFLSTYCVGCHNAKLKTANLNLEQFSSVAAVRSNLKVWKKVAWKLQEREMPPAKTPQPKPLAHRAMLKWVKAELALDPPAKK